MLRHNPGAEPPSRPGKPAPTLWLMGSTETTPMKVLLVDDQFPELELYRLAFTMHGHSVVTAASGTQAIEIFGTEHPDAVLVDLILGDMVGTEAIAKMREIGNATFFLLSE